MIVEIHEDDVVVCNGIKVAGAMFKFFADAANTGRKFTFVGRENDTVTISTILED